MQSAALAARSISVMQHAYFACICMPHTSTLHAVRSVATPLGAFAMLEIFYKTHFWLGT